MAISTSPREVNLRWPDCDREKVKFKSERAAWNCAVKNMKYRGRQLYTYFCRDCKAWHLTKVAREGSQ